MKYKKIIVIIVIAALFVISCSLCCMYLDLKKRVNVVEENNTKHLKCTIMFDSDDLNTSNMYDYTVDETGEVKSLITVFTYNARTEVAYNQIKSYYNVNKEFDKFLTYDDEKKTVVYREDRTMDSGQWYKNIKIEMESQKYNCFFK